jgi:hypothetical protein
VTLLKTLAVTLTLLLVGENSYADVAPLLSIDPAIDGTFAEPANNKTWGYSFYVTTPLRVTHLAWNDTGRDGLSHSHQVGIWKDTTGMTQWPYINGGTLIASATIPAGTAAELSGPWRRVPITPITLQVGGYSIGGQNNSQSLDNMMYIYFGVSDHPTGLDSRVIAGSFTFNTTGDDGFYAPGTHNSGWYLLNGAEVGSMMFVENVPEPSCLVVVAVLALTGARLRRQSLCRQSRS